MDDASGGIASASTVSMGITSGGAESGGMLRAAPRSVVVFENASVSTDRVYIVRRALVYEIVEPVGIQKICT